MGNVKVTSATIKLKDHGGGVWGSVPTVSGGLVINGSGFGSGPTVVLFDRFSDQEVGETVNTTADIGQWKNGGNSSFPTRPPIVEFLGRKAITHNNPDSGQGATRYGLEAHDFNGLPSYDRYTEFYKIGIPAGKTFPGAAVAETFPSTSSMKFTWHQGVSVGGVDGAIDLVSLTHAGSGTFKGEGNNIKGLFWGGLSSAWGWNEFNSVLNIYAPDSPDVQGVNGSHNLNMWNSNQQFSSINDPFACWQENPSSPTPMPTPLEFDIISILAWSGNGDSHADSQLVMERYYLSVGANHEKVLLLANNSSLSLATNVDAIPADTWADTLIEATLSEEEIADNTHYFVMENQTIIKTGAL